MSKGTSGASRWCGWQWGRTPQAAARPATANPTARRVPAEVSAIVAAVLAIASCARFAPQSEYKKAWAEYQRGELTQAVAACARNAERWRGRPESPWYWRFRLLQAEALAAQGNNREALA